MNRLFALLLAVVLVVGTSPGQVPTVEIRIKEKSGFLGMGGPRSIRLQLSNEARQLPLTDSLVNAGDHYLFLCSPVGDWLFDNDFINEDLPRLSIAQGPQQFPVEWKSAFAEGDSSLLIGFSKQIRLDQTLRVEFNGDGTADTVDLQIPLRLWPGYSAFNHLAEEARTAYTSGAYKTCIALCEQILETTGFAKFPRFPLFRELRTKSFESFYTAQRSVVEVALTNPTQDLKAKIAAVDSSQPAFQFVLDSIPRPSLNISATDSAVAGLVATTQQALVWASHTRDSLQQALDDQNVRWILEGSVTGRTGFQYQIVLEALAYGFSSLDFSDTAATHPQCTISEEMRATLEKNNLTDSYETFVRLALARLKAGDPLLTGAFLDNVYRDSASFSLPYFSILNAVNSYYAKDFETSMTMIFRIFRVCYDPEISARFDQMRIMISVRRGEFPAGAMRLLNEANAEESTNPDAAGELYRQATVIAPQFAYASFSLGRYYNHLGDPIRAQTFFERAYQEDTLYLSAYRESYNLYRRVGNYKPMIQVLTRALETGNDYWEIHSNLGLAFMGDGDPARAIQQYELALAINPRSYTTNIQLGLAYQTVKNYQKAREYFNSAINIDPLRQEAVEYLSRLNELQRSGK